MDIVTNTYSDLLYIYFILLSILTQVSIILLYPFNRFNRLSASSDQDKSEKLKQKTPTQIPDSQGEPLRFVNPLASLFLNSRNFRALT